MDKINSKQSFDKAPPEVQYIMLAAFSGIPLGYEFYTNAIDKYPEYFPEESEYKRKWKLIPKSAHSLYWAEYLELDRQIYKDVPPSKGILYWINNPKELKEWEFLRSKAKEMGAPLKKALHEKHYLKYDIPYNDTEQIL